MQSEEGTRLLYDGKTAVLSDVNSCTLGSLRNR